MLKMGLPWWEFAVRAVVVYLFLFVCLRLTGKRQVAQLSRFDFILLLILSNAVQNSMNGGDNSLLGGLISALVLIGLNWLLSFVDFKNKRVSRFLEGKPEILIHNGRLFEETLERERISHDELNSILRRSGVIKIEDVKYAMIEPSGDISVIKK